MTVILWFCLLLCFQVIFLCCVTGFWFLPVFGFFGVFFSFVCLGFFFVCLFGFCFFFWGAGVRLVVFWDFFAWLVVCLFVWLVFSLRLTFECSSKA